MSIRSQNICVKLEKTESNIADVRLKENMLFVFVRLERCV